MTNHSRKPRKKAAPRGGATELDAMNYPGNWDEEMAGDVTVSLDPMSGFGMLTPQSFDRLAPEDREACLELMRLVGKRRNLARDIDQAVEHLRAHHGVSWSLIGWCVGTTGEAARQRWGER